MSETPSDSSRPLAEIAHGPSKFEEFLDKNQKLLLLLAILIALLAAAYVVMRGVEQGKQEAAGASLIEAQNADELEKTIVKHAGSQAAKSAELLLADHQWSNGNKERSIATLRSFLADRPDHPATPTAKASLASKLMSQNENDEAARLFQELVDDPEARYVAAYALISIGDIAALAGNTEKARATFERVAAEFSGSEFSSTAGSRMRDLSALAPTVVAKPEPLEIKPELPADDAQTNADQASMEEEITLNPDKLAPTNNPPIPTEEKSSETEPAPQE